MFTQNDSTYYTPNGRDDLIGKIQKSANTKYIPTNITNKRIVALDMRSCHYLHTCHYTSPVGSIGLDYIFGIMMSVIPKFYRNEVTMCHITNTIGEPK